MRAYSKNEIEEIINKFKYNIINDNYFVLYDRNKNREFMEFYGLSILEIKEILLNISIDSFCHSIVAEDLNFLDKELWVFVSKNIIKDFNDDEKEIYVYLKWYFEADNSIVVSFHEAKYEGEYYFNKKEE